MKKDQYKIGFTDYRGIHGDPVIEWEPIRYSRKFEWGLAFCYFMLAISVSMTVAPMVWVELFKWMLS